MSPANLTGRPVSESFRFSLSEDADECKGNPRSTSCFPGGVAHSPCAPRSRKPPLL